MQTKQALQESDSLWTTLHIPSHHYIRWHNSISGWWAEKVGSLPGRRFHGSQPPKVMRFSANSMKSGLNFGYKLDNSCLRSISRMVYGNALHIWQSIMWPYGWDFVMVPTETWKAAPVLTFFLFSYTAQKMVDLNTWLYPDSASDWALKHNFAFILAFLAHHQEAVPFTPDKFCFLSPNREKKERKYKQNIYDS